MNRSVLLTGASGVIGSALVPLLLSDEDVSIFLLLRAESEEHLTERLQSLLKFWQISSDSDLCSRIRLIRGDLSRPQLGLAPDDYRLLSEKITHIVHAAGNVRLNQPLEVAHREMVAPLRELLQLIQACQKNHAFAKLSYLSTVGVAGRIPGTIYENPIRQTRSFRNNYEAAKAEAEDLLFSPDAEGIPITVYRPSMVVGDSSTGRVIRFQVFYHLCELLSGIKTRGFVPDGRTLKLDIIPVNLVTEMLHLTYDNPHTVGKIFHLSSGELRALPLTEIAERSRTILKARGVALPRLRVISPCIFRLFSAALRTIGPPTLRRLADNLNYFLDYLEEPQIFDNSNTINLLKDHGIELPWVDEYFETVLGYYLTEKK